MSCPALHGHTGLKSPGVESTDAEHLHPHWKLPKSATSKGETVHSGLLTLQETNPAQHMLKKKKKDMWGITVVGHRIEGKPLESE